MTTKIGIGVIVRDSEGNVCGSLQANKSVLKNLFTVEAIALWQAICFCIDAGFHSFILEGDADQVVKLLENESNDWSE